MPTYHIYQKTTRVMPNSFLISSFIYYIHCTCNGVYLHSTNKGCRWQPLEAFPVYIIYIIIIYRYKLCLIIKNINDKLGNSLELQKTGTVLQYYVDNGYIVTDQIFFKIKIDFIGWDFVFSEVTNIFLAFCYYVHLTVIRILYPILLYYLFIYLLNITRNKPNLNVH